MWKMTGMHKINIVLDPVVYPDAAAKVYLDHVQLKTATSTTTWHAHIGVCSTFPNEKKITNGKKSYFFKCGLSVIQVSGFLHHVQHLVTSDRAFINSHQAVAVSVLYCHPPPPVNLVQ